MKKEEAVDKFNQYQTEAKRALASCAEDPIVRNQAVTAHYNAIAKADPLFAWFGAATLGSQQVGKILNCLKNVPLDDAKIISETFPKGNQAIHNNMAALYTMYKKDGLDALITLNAADSDLLTNDGLNGFRAMDALQQNVRKKAAEIAVNTGNWGVKNTDTAAIGYLLQNDSNFRDDLKKACMNFVKQEQTIVNFMYDADTSVKRTLGDMLSNPDWQDKLQAQVADWGHLNGAELLDGEYYSILGYDFSSYDKRLEYLDTVIDGYFSHLAAGRLEEYGWHRDTLLKNNPYTDHWTVPVKSEALITKADFMKMEFCLVHDAETHQWVQLTQHFPIIDPYSISDRITGSWCAVTAPAYYQCPHQFDGLLIKGKNGSLVNYTTYHPGEAITSLASKYSYEELISGAQVPVPQYKALDLAEEWLAVGDISVSFLEEEPLSLEQLFKSLDHNRPEEPPLSQTEITRLQEACNPVEPRIAANEVFFIEAVEPIESHWPNMPLQESSL